MLQIVLNVDKIISNHQAFVSNYIQIFPDTKQSILILC